MKITKKYQLLLTTIVCYLPYFFMIMYDHFSDVAGARIIPYYKALLVILLGPLGMLVLDPQFFTNNFENTVACFITISPLIIMAAMLSVGTWKIEKSIFFKLLYAIGISIWFFYGALTVGLMFLGSL